MRKSLLAGAAAASVLAGCEKYTPEMYPQEDFIGATQENIGGTPTTIEVFEAGTNNPGVINNPNCIRNDIARGVTDILLEENSDRETVDVCLFPNKTNTPIS